MITKALRTGIPIFMYRFFVFIFAKVANIFHIAKNLTKKNSPRASAAGEEWN